MAKDTKIIMQTGHKPVIWKDEVVGFYEPVLSKIGKWQYTPLSPPVSRVPERLQRYSSPYRTLREVRYVIEKD